MAPRETLLEPVWIDEAMVHLAYSHLKSKQPEVHELLELLEGVYKRQLSPTLPLIQLRYDCFVMQLLVWKIDKDSPFFKHAQTMVDRLFPSLLKLMRQTAKTSPHFDQPPAAATVSSIVIDPALHIDTENVLSHLIEMLMEANGDCDLYWISHMFAFLLERDVVGS